MLLNCIRQPQNLEVGGGGEGVAVADSCGPQHPNTL